ncbi:TetR/AcrR family transcriptional regulator [Flavivirga amylovorans]|uniref:TetR/AcrR family transcriptional regulator n=1 Tax=Flavivirga amylovorans TaxID=870486 RepID=A0ABT8WZ08_9FLAO|nr:TetR/AcrR family transcriptional regulator [Flavivirga amylovorans]MDO5986925.1 TetR/AcrR family transcriptional regulator [Flavivirga amylovorans]
MRNTKKNILSTSKLMFNKKGYSHVTIRMIALKLKISSGNLNYHFKKREDILEALYFEMVSEFDSRIKHLDKKEITLKTIKKDIHLSMQRMIDYRFFWTDLYNLLRQSKKIKTHFEEVYTNRIKGYHFLLDTLVNIGLIQNFEFVYERQFLIERMIGFSNTWIYNSLICNEKINAEYIDLQSDNLLYMLYPYFTDLGKEQYKSLTSHFFE